MSEIESQVQPLVNAYPDIKSCGHSQECTRNKIKDARPCGWLSSNGKWIPFTRHSYLPSTNPWYVFWLSFDARDLWRATSREQASKHKPEEMTKAIIAVSFFFWAASWSYWLRPAQRTQRRLSWSALGLDCLASIPSFFPTLPASETCFTDFFFSPPGFVSQVHLFWKGWRCLNGLVLLFSICRWSIIIGVPNREWPNGILVVPTRCCVSRKVYCIIFAMFSPTRMSVWSCSHVILMCEIRSQELADPPPRCVWLEPRRYSWDCTLEFYSSPSIWLESSAV